MTYDFSQYKKDSTTRPSSKAWGNWKKFDKVGDMVQGYIRDVFYRKAEGIYKDARGITLEQPDGSLVNVSIKRIDFVLGATDNLRIGDPLTVVLEEEKESGKGNPTKIFGYYGKNLPENAGNKTVAELDAIDRANGGQDAGSAEADAKADKDMAEMTASATAAVETPKTA